MSFFSQAGIPLDQVKDLSPIPPELQLFARIEAIYQDNCTSISSTLTPVQRRLCWHYYTSFVRAGANDE